MLVIMHHTIHSAYVADGDVRSGQFVMLNKSGNVEPLSPGAAVFGISGDNANAASDGFIGSGKVSVYHAPGVFASSHFDKKKQYFAGDTVYVNGDGVITNDAEYKGFGPVGIVVHSPCQMSLGGIDGGQEMIGFKMMEGARMPTVTKEATIVAKKAKGRLILHEGDGSRWASL